MIANTLIPQLTCGPVNVVEAPAPLMPPMEFGDSVSITQVDLSKGVGLGVLEKKLVEEKGLSQNSAQMVILKAWALNEKMKKRKVQQQEYFQGEIQECKQNHEKEIIDKVPIKIKAGLLMIILGGFLGVLTYGEVIRSPLYIAGVIFITLVGFCTFVHGVNNHLPKKKA